MDNTLQWAVAQILNKLYPDFYGNFTLNFQAGKLSGLKVEETMRPPTDGS